MYFFCYSNYCNPLDWKVDVVEARIIRTYNFVGFWTISSTYLSRNASYNQCIFYLMHFQAYNIVFLAAKRNTAQHINNRFDRTGHRHIERIFCFFCSTSQACMRLGLSWDFFSTSRTFLLHYFCSFSWALCCRWYIIAFCVERIFRRNTCRKEAQTQT